MYKIQCGLVLVALYTRLAQSWERNGRNIQGLAFDPATELLFFSDANEKSINWISLKPGANNYIYGNLLVKIDDGIPTGVAVDSCRGFVYWINTNLTTRTPTIERARFNGSERAVVIDLNSVTVNETYTMEPHSLVIDQQTQKMYWVEPVEPFMYKTYSANLNGKNIGAGINFNSVDTVIRNPSNVLTVSNTSLIFWDWGKSTVWAESKEFGLGKKLFNFETENISIGIVANYKIADQVLGLTNCDALKNLVPNFSVSNHSLKLTKESEGLFCVNGTKDIGQSRCKCTPGYIGERCDVSVCTNYCLHGSCSINDEGLPICSCYAGYTGKRCEVDGNCSLNEVDAPVCQCDGNHEGSRRESAEAVSPIVHDITHLTLVDLLSKWRKPSAKVTVTIEV